jgi:hypothetical protein
VELSFSRKRLPEFPAGPEFNTVILHNREPRPADAPDEPRSIGTIRKALEAGGWTVKTGYSRAWRKGQRTGTYRKAEFFGLFGGLHETSPFRTVSVYWRFMDKTEEFEWYRDVLALEQSEKACGTPGGWTWADSRIVRGFERHRCNITDLKEFASVRGSVLPGWFAGIERRYAEQAAKELCGEPEDHFPAHTWENSSGTVKMCSGKAKKAKESEAA